MNLVSLVQRRPAYEAPMSQSNYVRILMRHFTLVQKWSGVLQDGEKKHNAFTETISVELAGNGFD